MKSKYRNHNSKYSDRKIKKITALIDFYHNPASRYGRYKGFKHEHIIRGDKIFFLEMDEELMTKKIMIEKIPEKYVFEHKCSVVDLDSDGLTSKKISNSLYYLLKVGCFVRKDELISFNFNRCQAFMYDVSFGDRGGYVGLKKIFELPKSHNSVYEKFSKELIPGAGKGKVKMMLGKEVIYEIRGEDFKLNIETGKAESLSKLPDINVNFICYPIEGMRDGCILYDGQMMFLYRGSFDSKARIECGFEFMHVKKKEKIPASRPNAPLTDEEIKKNVLSAYEEIEKFASVTVPVLQKCIKINDDAICCRDFNNVLHIFSIEEDKMRKVQEINLREKLNEILNFNYIVERHCKCKCIEVEHFIRDFEMFFLNERDFLFYNCDAGFYYIYDEKNDLIEGIEKERIKELPDFLEFFTKPENCLKNPIALFKNFSKQEESPQMKPRLGRK